MSPRTIRRAAEHKARKQAAKAARQEQSEAQPVCSLESEQPPISSLEAEQPPVSQPASAAQLAANRANAQLSTGPATAAGKEISSRNHTTHGLTAMPTHSFKVLPDEDQDAFDHLLATYRREWTPTTATEQDLVTRLAVHSWLRDRAVRFQHNILCEVGEEIAVNQRKDFALYMRYHHTHERAYSKTLLEMMRLRRFQTSQQKSEAIMARRVVDLQIRFESQKQKAELHVAKLETIRLKQEAMKQRNPAKTTVQPVEKATTAVASGS